MFIFLGRDFSNESILNIIFRMVRAASSRLRGRIYVLFNMFSRKTSYNITIGKGTKVMNGKWIYLGENVSFSNFCRLECYSNQVNNSKEPKIIIGDNTSFGDMTHIGAINKITIGKNVLGASKILIVDHNHGLTKSLDEYQDIPPRERELISNGEIIIEDNVWIGENVVILAGAKIGRGAIISAGSKVSKDVESFTIFYNKK